MFPVAGDAMTLPRGSMAIDSFNIFCAECSDDFYYKAVDVVLQ
jgi:hypothetical protein